MNVAQTSATPAASAPERISVQHLALLLVQLGLLAIVLRQFQIESNALLTLALVAFTGFAVHALLPLPARLPFFVLLSIAGIGIVFGVREGAWLITLGLTLIAVCHLPIAFRL